MSNTTSTKNPGVRFIAVLLALITIFLFAVPEIDASAASRVTVAAPRIYNEAKYDSSSTHPYNKQMSELTVKWSTVSGADGYRIYIKGGKYKSWTRLKIFSSRANSYTITGLNRATAYQICVRATKGNTISPLSNIQTFRTSRINYDYDGWKAICRIVYHEVGRANGNIWDKALVYVSDAVVNRFYQAKIVKNPVWANQYRRFSNIQGMIYNSGEFMSSAGLSRDGADYYNVPNKVKRTAYGALYGVNDYKNIANRGDVFFWCNTGYKPSGKNVAYTMPIPWGGYFSVWTSYWG
ncbi:MAG: fibronectin type III domain-containing protein [Oscillospiraceae bacterium]